MILFSNLNLYLIEIIIFLGALLCIVVGAFSKKRKYNKVYIYHYLHYVLVSGMFYNIF